MRERIDGKSDRFRTSDPEVALSDAGPFALMLEIFELATNSAKYRALSAAAGSVFVEWSIRGPWANATFTFRWREEGGPVVDPPQRRGFGSFLMKQLLAAEFGGDVTVEYLKEGVVCQLTCLRNAAALGPGAT
ncbi:hypothetical protein [Falsirhodobacter sp. 1013]|uniref:hypothetical protein n=1 Tax=Falsirhodobacter sp. 1013 TaxID=3417566 RepID=UPI003EBF5658